MPLRAYGVRCIKENKNKRQNQLNEEGKILYILMHVGTHTHAHTWIHAHTHMYILALLRTLQSKINIELLGKPWNLTALS